MAAGRSPAAGESERIKSVVVVTSAEQPLAAGALPARGAAPRVGAWAGQPGTVLLRHEAPDGRLTWRLFARPQGIIQANTLAEVGSALREVEAAMARGRYAAGFLTYEAAPAFDAALVTRAAGPLPLLWFGLYDGFITLPALPEPVAPFTVSSWTPHLRREEYARAIARVRDYIAAGDTYQVNYTLRLRASFAGDPFALFRALCQAQEVRYPAYVDLGGHALCSASPELFFRLSGTTITARPMKGTAPRGCTLAEDEALAAELAASAKNRAENVMIVDMVRNDLGRIAATGTVCVPHLFAVERYDTLFQMTSTVTASTRASFSEILGALFPCASITGAPKVRTMQIIAELESAPRGIYTGCIGCLDPGRQAQFNIAIRTVHVDRQAGRAEYGTGGGVVWDSTDAGEYDECLTKALILTAERPRFRLLETLLWRPEQGYFLLERHLARLLESAAYFGFHVDAQVIERRLAEAASSFAGGRQRVRLLVEEDGSVTVEAAPLMPAPRRRWRVAFAREPVDRRDRFLYHKTTHRAVYEAARAALPGMDDVILWNAEGEVTEATIANVVGRRGRELVTPPISCGLLAGTYRAHLLEQGRIREGVLTLQDVRQADALYLINSVRGWIPAVLAEPALP